MSKPVLVQVSNDHYRLVEDFSYTWTNHGIINRIIVRAGFEFDGASIPSGIAPLMGGKWGLGHVPPLIHDMLYRCGGCVKCSHEGNLHEILLVHGIANPKQDDYFWLAVDGHWTREEADKMFGRHMREHGIPKVRRRLAYYGVRLGGRYFWDPSCCSCDRKVRE